MDKLNYANLTKTQLSPTMECRMKQRRWILSIKHQELEFLVVPRTSLAATDRYSVAALEGTSDTPPVSIIGRQGVDVFALDKPENEGTYWDIVDAAKKLNNETDQHSSIFCETWSQQFTNGIDEGLTLANDLDSVVLDPSIWFNNGNQFASDATEAQHWETWSTVNKLMKPHANRSTDRDIFYTEFGGWDTHQYMKRSIRSLFRGLNHGLSPFWISSRQMACGRTQPLSLHPILLAPLLRIVMMVRTMRGVVITS